jgi:hypothetical protein
VLNAIEAGRIFVREGTALPKTLQIESELYMPGRRAVKNLDGDGLDRKIHDAGWTFFCLAYETKATVFGIDAEKMVRRAIERILVNRDAEAEKFNSLEITRVGWWASRYFLEIRHVTVSAQSRHIQESPVIFQVKDKDFEVPVKVELGCALTKALGCHQARKYLWTISKSQIVNLYVFKGALR